MFYHYPEQIFFEFGIQNDLQKRRFGCPKSYCPPGASLKRSKRLLKWLEKLSNGSKTSSKMLQEASNSSQSILRTLQLTLHSSSFAASQIHNLYGTIHNLLYIVDGSIFMLLRPQLSLPCLFSKLHMRTVPSFFTPGFMIRNVQIEHSSTNL